MGPLVEQCTSGACCPASSPDRSLRRSHARIPTRLRHRLRYNHRSRNASCVQKPPQSRRHPALCIGTAEQSAGGRVASEGHGLRAALTPRPSIAETRDTSPRPHRGTDGVSLAAGRAEASLVEPYCDGPRRGAFDTVTASERWTSRRGEPSGRRRGRAAPRGGDGGRRSRRRTAGRRPTAG